MTMRMSVLLSRAMPILWPAFLMAGVLETLIFSVVDPGDLHWIDGAPMAWTAQAVYTLAFLVLWAAISAAGALTLLLIRTADEINRDDAIE